MLPASSWPAPLRRAIEFCLGEDFDPDRVIVDPWSRPFSAKESYRITIDGRRLFAVIHRPDDGGAGVAQLCVRVIGQLWAVNKLSDVDVSVATAKRACMQAAAGFCVLMLVLIGLTASGLGDQQVSFSVSF